MMTSKRLVPGMALTLLLAAAAAPHAAPVPAPTPAPASPVAAAPAKPAPAKRAAARKSSPSSESKVAPSPGTTAEATPSTPSSRATNDTTMTIPAGQEGAVFKSLTVEGEDRVHLEFERPPLTLDLDPSTAPGLDWGTAADVLNRTVPDFGAPMLQSSAAVTTPGVAHPWLGHFMTGPVARFRPDVKGVERWKLTIVDSKGQTVAGYEGKGEPPAEITWDGRTTGGGLVVPGLTYSYVMEARDRAGNKRNFVGQGFKVTAYRLDSVESPMMVFTGKELPASDPTRPASSPGDHETSAPILIEAASWLNQSAKALQSVKVTATARTAEQAQTLCALVTRQMTPYLLGDPARVLTATEVQPDAPEGGAVRIAAGR